MESRFAHLRQRDSSVSMLRVKMSRRRSQSQKENRDRALNSRRPLEKLQEMESSSLDVSTVMTNMSTIHEKTQNAKPAKNEAGEERAKQLQRWKERKALEKEKEKREKEGKGVFKTGWYHPEGTFTVVPLPPVTAVSTRAKGAKLNTTVTQSTRVTRSMKQQQQQQAQKPLKDQERNTAVKKAQPAAERSTRSRAAVKPVLAPAVTRTKVCPVEPVVRGLSTRSTNRPPVTAVPAVKEKPADAKTTRARGSNKPGAPSSGTDRNCKVTTNDTVQPEDPVSQEPEQRACPSSPRPCAEEREMEREVEMEKEKEEEMVVDQPPADSAPAADPVENCSSFAPQGFVFQAPTGLSSIKFEPLTPRSADAFLTPSSSFNVTPLLDLESEQSEPSPPKSPSLVQPTPACPQEPEHDVPYFRSEMSSKTVKLTSLCGDWEAKVEDQSIPEEMRDSMRTAIGQARLLMKERFNQFSGLVDDCELGRGEKITTCTDLQGFWDMVYYQVEDVYKKFNDLKEAEARGWVEEHKPAPPQRKAVKKAPAAAAAKPAGTNAAAKSRLAAVKAAMKAKQQAGKVGKASGNAEDESSLSAQEPQPQAAAQPADVVVFDGGFFQVESPAKPTGSVRRASRLSAAVPPQASPSPKYLTPRRVTRGSTASSLAPLHTNASLAQTARLSLAPTKSPGRAPKSHPGTPQPAQSTKTAVNVSLCFSPVKEVPSDGAHSQGSLIPTSVEDGGTLPVSPRRSLSPCDPPPSCQEPESFSVPTLTLSPCRTPSQPPLSYLTVISPLLPRLDRVEARMSMGPSPASVVVEDIPGLDIERYLQPSLRCSLSPRETVTMETSSPMAVDVEMESPRAQGGDLPTQDELALPAVSTVLTPQSPQAQTAASALLLFTPDLKDRIRQSLCPSDLMVFTPPDMQ